MFRVDILHFVRNQFYFIDEEEFEEIEARKELRLTGDRKLFLLEKDDVYIAIDNLTGDFYVEEFKIMNDAIIWLSGLKEVEPLQKAEEMEFWY